MSSGLIICERQIAARESSRTTENVQAFIFWQDMFPKDRRATEKHISQPRQQNDERGLWGGDGISI
jgi:hypothetical protein